MKVVQITDTHFGAEKQHFNGNWAPLLEWIGRTGPDLIVHTGDLTVDGADKAEDIVFCKNLMDQAPAPMLIVPGNHDVGHMPGSEQPVNGERLQRWRSLAGEDRWFHDAGDWRLIGLNSLLLGLENEEEDAQFEWLRKALEERGGRRIAMFGHKPLFLDDPHEGETGYWGARPRERSRLFELFATHDVALYASGHVHWAWQGRHGNTALTWGPSAAYVIDKLEPEMPGERLIGAAVHTFGDDVSTELVTVPGMTRYVIDDVVDEVYPRPAKAEAAQ